MKIKEFSITHYGPLTDVGRIPLHNFNLIFGKNEYGKTLTIDALLKFLLGRNVKPREFERIDRVGERPEGYVILEDQEGGQIKLPERGDLEEIMELTPADCRNIFVIRDSDLSIHRETEFYTEITDRLTGLRTKEISRIKDSLRRIGGITPSGIFIDTREEKLKTRIENAGILIGRIDELSKRAKDEGFDEFEGESARLGERKDVITQKIRDLEDARKRERLEIGEKALEKLEESLTKIGQLEVFNHDDEQLWRDCERDAQGYSKEKGDLLKELDEKNQELKETNEKLNEEERDFRLLEDRKKTLDEEIRPQLKNYETESERLAGLEKKSRFFGTTEKICAILFGVSLFGVFVRPSLFFYILAILFLILTAVSWIFIFLSVRDKAGLSSAFERINLALSRFGLESEGIEGINSNIQGFREEYSKEAGELKSLGIKRDGFRNDIERLKEMVIRLEKKIKDTEDKVIDLKRKSREDSFEGYSGKLETKKGYGEALREQKSVLESLFGSKHGTMEEDILYWNEEIRDLELCRDKARTIKYAEKTISKLKDEEDSIKEKLEGLEDKIVHFKKDLDEIERETNKILQTGSEPEHLYCKTHEDLIAVRNRLLGFVKETESNRDAVLKAIKIFEEIETEEKERILELFGKDSSIAKYFKEITDGLYNEVLFNQKTGKIEVKRKDGVILEAEKLSGGAYDQLYLSVRIALGEKLLKGTKGFFIMDDPFVKADQDRLENQIAMLEEISGSGWQIIYFSAKEEIRAALSEQIRTGVVNYHVLKMRN